MTANIFRIGFTWYINFIVDGEIIKTEHEDSEADAIATARRWGCKSATIHLTHFINF